MFRILRYLGIPPQKRAEGEPGGGVALARGLLPLLFPLRLHRHLDMLYAHAWTPQCTQALSTPCPCKRVPLLPLWTLEP